MVERHGVRSRLEKKSSPLHRARVTDSPYMPRTTAMLGINARISIEVCITRLRVARTTWTDFVDLINGIFIVFHLLVNYLKLHNIYSAHYLQLSSLQLTDGAFIKHCVCTVHRSSYQNNPRIKMPSHHYLLYNQPNTQKSWLPHTRVIPFSPGDHLGKILYINIHAYMYVYTRAYSLYVH